MYPCRVEYGFIELNIQNIHAGPSSLRFMAFPPFITSSSTKRVLDMKKFAVNYAEYMLLAANASVTTQTS